MTGEMPWRVGAGICGEVTAIYGALDAHPPPSPQHLQRRVTENVNIKRGRNSSYRKFDDYEAAYQDITMAVVISSES